MSTGPNYTLVPSATIQLDPYANVLFAGQQLTGSQAVDWFLTMKVSNPAEYRRTVAALKAGGWSGAPENAFADAVATAQRLNKDFKDVLTQSALAGYGSETSTVSIANSRRAIERYAMQNGISLTPKEVNSLTSKSISNKWDAETLKEEIAREGVVAGGVGEATTEDTLKKNAAAYGVSYSPEWYMQAAKSILEGKSTADIWNQEIKNTAKSRYAAFADQIDSGLTPRDIASPYLQSMANILELDPNTINLSDPTISKALTSITEDGKPAVTPLWQFERELKKDSRWRYTKNAQEELIGTGVQVLKDFGLV